MLSSTIGAPAGHVQPPVSAQKPEQAEEFAKTAPEQLAAPAAKEGSTPPVPGSSGAPISIEAITVLQQADDANANVNATQAANERQTARTDVATNAASVEANGAQDPIVEADDPQGTESRQSAESEVPAGEETDAAGRSARNPINLQI